MSDDRNFDAEWVRELEADKPEGVASPVVQTKPKEWMTEAAKAILHAGSWPDEWESEDVSEIAGIIAAHMPNPLHPPKQMMVNKDGDLHEECPDCRGECSPATPRQIARPLHCPVHNVIHAGYCEFVEGREWDTPVVQTTPKPCPHKIVSIVSWNWSSEIPNVSIKCGGCGDEFSAEFRLSDLLAIAADLGDTPVVQEAPQPLESRPSEDAFESAWRECNANGNAGGWERIAFISGFEKGFKAAQAPLREAAQRSDKDYAIEHAEYLAKAAEHLMDEINKYDMAESAGDECDADARSGAWQSLRSAIGEFRKRAKRASESSSVLREAATPRKSDYCRDCRQPVTGSVHVEMVTGQKICFRCFKRMGEPQKIEGPAQEALADSSAPKEK